MKYFESILVPSDGKIFILTSQHSINIMTPWSHVFCHLVDLIRFISRHGEMDYLDKSILQKVDVDMARWIVLTSQFHKKKTSTWPEVLLFVGF